MTANAMRILKALADPAAAASLRVVVVPFFRGDQNIRFSSASAVAGGVDAHSGGITIGKTNFLPTLDGTTILEADEMYPGSPSAVFFVGQVKPGESDEDAIRRLAPVTPAPMSLAQQYVAGLQRRSASQQVILDALPDIARDLEARGRLDDDEFPESMRP